MRTAPKILIGYENRIDPVKKYPDNISTGFEPLQETMVNG